MIQQDLWQANEGKTPSRRLPFTSTISHFWSLCNSARCLLCSLRDEQSTHPMTHSRPDSTSSNAFRPDRNLQSAPSGYCFRRTSRRSANFFCVHILAPGAAKDNPIAFPFRVADVVVDVGMRAHVYVSHKNPPCLLSSPVMLDIIEAKKKSQCLFSNPLKKP